MGPWRSVIQVLGWFGFAGSAATTAGPFPRTDVSVCKIPGFSLGSNVAPSTGSLNAYMFFVDFSDAPAVETTTSLRDFFLPGGADWYETSSYGKLHLNVTADTSRFYRMPARSDSYNWQRGLTTATHRIYIQDALSAYAKTIAPTDVLYIVPTREARAISFSPTFMNEVKTRAGVHVAGKSVTFGLDAYTTWQYKVLNHETGHTLGLLDYYPYDGGPTTLYVGGWSLMGLISGPSPDYFAFDKWRLGWLSDNQFDCIANTGSTTHTLSPVEIEPGKKAAVVKHSNTDLLVVEVRSNLGVNTNPCATGVLLYTVSTKVAGGYGPVKVLDATPNSGGCAGDELNDATLTLDRTSSYTVAGWGIKVTLLKRNGNDYDVRVDVL